MKVLNNIVGLFNNAVLLEFFINPQYYKNLFVLLIILQFILNSLFFLFYKILVKFYF